MIGKRIAILLFLCFLSFSGVSQIAKRKGFIGLSLGPSFLLDYKVADTKAGTGLNINILNFGYVFDRGFGVSASWIGGAHIFKADIQIYDQGTAYSTVANCEVIHGALMIGPMYSIKISNNACFDVKALCGRFFANEAISSYPFESKTETNSLGYSFSIAYRIQFASRWCTMLSSDYYSGKNEFSFSGAERLTPLSLNVGLGFML